MPDGLSLRTTALLVALAFALAFGVQALLGGVSSAAKPAAKASVADAPGAAPELRLAATQTVPALLEPRQPRRHKRLDRKPVNKPTPSVRNPAGTAPEFTPTPAASVSPTPTAAPPAPPHVTPAPKPRAAPAPTSPPASGEFDTTGEP